MKNAVALPTYIQEKVSRATVPIQYTAAIKALAKCRTINDAKLYADKADALAAWAKIYKEDGAQVEARRLKLHAFRRIGDLANELRPTTHKPGKKGCVPGAKALLLETGLSPNQVTHIIATTKVPRKKFNKMVASVAPPSPSAITTMMKSGSDAWKLVQGSDRGSLSKLRYFCRANDPKTLARGLTLSESVRARNIAIEIAEWIDTFEQYLPADAK